MKSIAFSLKSFILGGPQCILDCKMEDVRERNERLNCFPGILQNTLGIVKHLMLRVTLK